MHNHIIGKTIKATIINVIVALFITTAMILSIYLLFGAKVEETISLVSKVSIDKDNKQIQETILNEENLIKNYPEYGAQYATIQIPKIDVDLPVYLGDTLEVLKKGVGHYSGSFFPRRRRFSCIYGAQLCKSI